jgi:hypothetical protein
LRRHDYDFTGADAHLQQELDAPAFMASKFLEAGLRLPKVEHCWETLGIATIRDGYVQNIRAIINIAVGLRRLNDPFQATEFAGPDSIAAREPTDGNRWLIFFPRDPSVTRASRI